MSRRWRIGIGIVAGLAALDLALHFVGTLTGGTPGGPESSSYATQPNGAGALAELLGRFDHPVDRVRRNPSDTSLDPHSTVFLLDADAVAEKDAKALRAFVAIGGRLVAAGGDIGWARVLISPLPRGVALGATFTSNGLSVRTAGVRAWTTPGATTPLAQSDHGILAVTRRIGRGRVILLADPSPLQNRLLAHADNAAFALVLAGSRRRPGAFLESYHGYGRSTGLTALPLAWKLLLAGLVLATLVWMIARGRRFGPPETRSRELPPPRSEYVDALAGVLARTRKRDEAVEPVRRRARAELLRRAALPADADDDALLTAARSLGIEDPEAIVRPARTDSDVIAVGRALARIGQDPRG
jgi:Domain of unknown function (DUF4350)